MKTSYIDINKAKELVKSGLSIKTVSEQLNVNYKTLYWYLTKDNVKNKVINKTPQLKAWDTRRKHEAIEKYNNAPTAGQKMVITKKFKTEFGINLKDILLEESKKIKTNKVKTKKVKTPKVTKETFKEEVFELMMPDEIKELFKRVEFLEKFINLLKSK